MAPKSKKSGGRGSGGEGRRLSWWMTLVTMLGIRNNPNQSQMAQQNRRATRNEESSGERRFRFPGHIRFSGRNRVAPASITIPSSAIEEPMGQEENPGSNEVDSLAEMSPCPQETQKGNTGNGEEFQFDEEECKDNLGSAWTYSDNAFEVDPSVEDNSYPQSDIILQTPGGPCDCPINDAAESTCTRTYIVENPVFKHCYAEDVSDDFYLEAEVEKLVDPSLPKQLPPGLCNRLPIWVQKASYGFLSPANQVDNFPKLFDTRNLDSQFPQNPHLHKVKHSLITFSTKTSSSFMRSDDYDVFDPEYLEEIDAMLMEKERNEDSGNEIESLNRLHYVPPMSFDIFKDFRSARRLVVDQSGSGDKTGVSVPIKSPEKMDGEGDGGKTAAAKKKGGLLRYINRRCGRVARAIGSLANIRPHRKVAPAPIVIAMKKEEEGGDVNKIPTKPWPGNKLRRL